MRRLHPLTAVRLCGLLTAAALTCRLVWVALGTETGWETIAIPWWHATAGWIAGERTPFGEKLPSEQAQRWLPNAKAELEAESRSAERLMGAALVLDSPVPQYVKHFMTEQGTANIAGTGALALPPKLHWDRVGKALAEYDAVTDDLCLDLAKAATSEEPENGNWWRLRALLQFRCHLYGESWQPRSTDWEHTLDECRKYDPDNGMYDLIEALVLWNKSSRRELDVESESERWIYKPDIHDAERHEAAMETFERALASPQISSGEVGLSSVVSFLDRAGAWSSEKQEIGPSRLVRFREQMLLTEINRWLSAVAEDQCRGGDTLAAKNTLLGKLQLADRIVECQEAIAFDSMPIVIAQAALYELQDLDNRFPESVSAEELADWKSREKSWQTRMASLSSLAQSRAAARSGEKLAISAGLLVSAAVVSGGTLLILLLVSGAVSRVLGRDATAASFMPRWHEQIGVWLFAYAMTFFLFGVCPTDVIRPLAQRWIIGVVTGIAILSAIVMLFVRYPRTRSLRFSLRALFVTMTMAAILAMLWAALELERTDWRQAIPACGQEAGFGPFSADFIRQSLQVGRQSVEWMMMQWFIHHGPYISLAAGFSLLSVFLIIRWTSPKRRDQAPGGLRTICQSFSSMMLRTSANLGLLWLIVYLWLTPSLVRATEEYHNELMQYVVDSESYCREMRDGLSRQ